MGDISLNHCLFVGNATVVGGWQPVIDGSTILKTVSTFNNISFFDCQDENIEFAYRNTNNPFDFIPLVFRNCLIRSKFDFTADGSVIFDSCRVAVIPGNGYAVKDSSSASVKLYLKGTYNFYTNGSGYGANPTNFVNSLSRIIYESTNIGAPYIAPSALPSYTTNSSRGIVKVPMGSTSITISNIHVTLNSLVFAQLRTNDTGGARIRDIVCSSGSFVINLSRTLATVLDIAFKIED